MTTRNSADIGTGVLNTILLGQGVGTALAFSTATYPPTTTINQLLYSSAANTIGGLTTANNGLLVTSSAGVPSVLGGPGTTGQVLQANAAAAPSFSTASYPSTTTINQILYSSAANTITGLATSASAVLTTVASVPTWAATLSLALGGTNASLTANNGGIFYSTATAGAILAGTATATQMLQSGASTTPAWSTTTWPATSTINQLLYSSAANTVVGLATVNSGTLATSSAGVPSIVALGATQVLVGVSGGTPAAGTIPGKNMVVNGDMQVWQRGAGGSAVFSLPQNTTQYCADRWQVQTSANCASTITQSAGATSGSFLCKVQRNNAQTGTGGTFLVTSLTRDMCIGAAGNVLTLSFKAKAGANFSAASSQIAIALYSGTGSTDISGIGGSFTGSVTVGNPFITITTTLTNYSTTFSALNSTVTQLCLEIYFLGVGTAGADDSFSVTDIQLEISPVQTPFERRSFGDSLALCQRFYWKTFSYATAPATAVGANTGNLVWLAGVVGANTTRSQTIFFPTTMLKSGTFTTYNTTNANAQVYDATAAADCSATTQSVFPQSVYLQCVGAVGTLAANILQVHLTHDADVT